MYRTYGYIDVNVIYAQIKEELRSYFNTGAVDDVLFDVYTNYVLSQFNRTYYKPQEAAIRVDNKVALLPDDFRYMRSVHTCENYTQVAPLPGARYYQKDCRITSRPRKRCDECQDLEEPCNSCDRCYNKDYMVTHRVTGHAIMNFSVAGVLIPDAFAKKNKCYQCEYKDGTAMGTYSISEDNCRLYVPFTNGIVHIEYYSDNDGEILEIPDRPNFKDYLIKYLKYKIFESLFNSTTDESYNQMSQKFALAKQEMEEAYIDAKQEAKRRNKVQIVKSIQQQRYKNNRYKI